MKKMDGPLSFSTATSNLVRISAIGSQKKMVMITEIVIAIERKYRLLLRCHNAYFVERLAISGKLYTTQSYSRPFKKENSIISINSSLNKVSIIQKTFSFHPKCDCIYSGCCLLDNPAHSKDLKIILFCDRLHLLQFPPPCYDGYSNQNLTAFLKVVDRDNISTEIVIPSEIRHKCIIINRAENESDICIPCNIRFEKD